MREMRDTYELLLGNSEGKKRLGRPRSIWEANIKMDLNDVVRCVNWFIWLRIGTDGKLFGSVKSRDFFY
jgi:hypothetical protein